MACVTFDPTGGREQGVARCDVACMAFHPTGGRENGAFYGVMGRAWSLTRQVGGRAGRGGRVGAGRVEVGR